MCIIGMDPGFQKEGSFVRLFMEHAKKVSHSIKNYFLTFECLLKGLIYT